MTEKELFDVIQMIIDEMQYYVSEIGFSIDDAYREYGAESRETQDAITRYKGAEMLYHHMLKELRKE